eukprot:755411-Hanusia_phi.AAC.3
MTDKENLTHPPRFSVCLSLPLSVSHALVAVLGTEGGGNRWREGERVRGGARRGGEGRAEGGRGERRNRRRDRGRENEVGRGGCRTGEQEHVRMSSLLQRKLLRQA